MSLLQMSGYRPVAEIAREIPPSRAGRPVSPQTVVAWITDGIPLNNGSILRMKGRRFPGGWMTTEDALVEFTDRLTEDATGEPAAQPSKVERPNRGHERAEAELRAAGL